MRFVMDMVADPAKLFQFPFVIFKMSIDFAQSILKLVV